VEFPNPVFTASGTWGYALEFLDLVDPALLGGVVTKTITVEPRSGNPQPRVRELPTGMLNSIGLENVGLRAFVEEKLPALDERGVRTIVSLAGRDEAEFGQMILELARHPGWVGVELNLSCPNVAKGGLDFGTSRESIARITTNARRELPVDKCLWVKLTPNDAPIADLAKAAEGAGADAISCINTLVGMKVDLRSRAPVFPRGTAGYSGPGIKPVALAKVWQAAHAVSIPIIGIGGIASVEDICEFFVVGAHAVQVGTMLFPRPDLAHTLLEELATTLARLGAASPRDLRAASLS
jgi:dihydroorotate dehydrogenase (NAD+) catalytic subunit